jgi:L-fuculose-phosphate aldolase
MKREDLHIVNVRKEVVVTSQLLSKKALMAGSWGNVSARIDKDSYAVTPSGHSYDTLTPDDIVIVNSDGMKMTGNSYPSTETKLHVAIYKQFPEAGAVIHTHSILCQHLGRAAQRPAAYHRRYGPGRIGGAVDLCGLRDAGHRGAGAERADRLWVRKRAAFMANHGVVCWGRDMKEAYMTAELVEKAAEIYCTAAGLGGAKELSKKDVER